MTAKGGKKTRGISIRAIHLAMILCAVAIAALLMVSTVMSTNVFSTLNRETEEYIVRTRAAHDLLEASDYLTEMVQRFTLEGDRTYMDSYFEEAFLSKRREAAILSMSGSGAEAELVARLQEAMDESQNLMYREYYAMKLVTEARHITDVPEVIRGMELNGEDDFLSEEEKMELAQRMVMGTEYYARKEIIRSRLQTNLEELDRMMSETRQETSTRMMRQLTGERVVVIVLAAVLIGLIILTGRLVTAMKGQEENRT